MQRLSSGSASGVRMVTGTISARQWYDLLRHVLGQEWEVTAHSQHLRVSFVEAEDIPVSLFEHIPDHCST